jgi:hypothetical protein
MSQLKADARDHGRRDAHHLRRRVGDLSLLHALAYVKSASGLNNLIAIEGGFLHDRIAGGALAASKAIAAVLGDRVRLYQPVAAD